MLASHLICVCLLAGLSIYIIRLRKVIASARTESEIAIRQISQLPVGVVRIDKENHIIAANDAARFLLRISDKHTLRPEVDLNDVICKDGLVVKRRDNPFLCGMRRRPFVSKTVGIHLKSDEIMWLMVSTEPLFSKNSDIYGASLCLQDVSTNVAQEIAIRDQRVALAKAAQFSSAGILSAGIAHEINNPLAIIKGHCEMARQLLDRHDTINARKRLEKVDIGINRIVKIVNTLRNFANGKKSQEAHRNFSIKETIHEALTLCGARFSDAGIKLVIEVEGDAFFKADTEVVQALYSLLVNAIDAEVEGGKPGKLVQIKGGSVDGFAEIAVENMGIKIPKRLAETLFLPFYTTKAPGSGTGLGLCISKNYIESIGGSLSLDTSAPSTRFVMLIPRVEEDVAA